MKGEAVASGSVHVDNIAPSLFGGLVLTVGIDNPNVKQIPVPPGVRCVLVHPHMMLSTREARADSQSIDRSVERHLAVGQSRRLSHRLFHRRSAADSRVARRRDHRAAAQGADSGFQGGEGGRDDERRAGLFDLRRRARRCSRGAKSRMPKRIRDAMVAGFTAHGLESDAWISTLDAGRRASRRLARSRSESPTATMHYISTRNPEASQCLLSEAIAKGIAPDGGLYVPESFPHFVPHQFDGDAELPEIGEQLLTPFADGDPLAGELGEICREAFNFPAPLVPLEQAPAPASVLELFHGPTCAFKDFGARFLAACMERIRRGAARKLTILVATSGDTGGAVAAAFHSRPGSTWSCCIRRGWSRSARRSSSPAGATTCARSACDGTFDECQRMVKEAFLDPALGETHQLSSANSINIGRLLPQMVYYAKAGLRAVARDRPARELHHSGRQSRQFAGVHLGAARRHADRRDRACDQRQSDRHRIPAHRRMGAARRACRRWRPRWTSAIRATWSACARCIRISKSCRARSAHRASMTSRSAARSAAIRTSCARCGARTRRRPPRSIAACCRAARAGIG